jgi:DHA3 family tetracycline resistance protein-like MFS transporter
VNLRHAPLIARQPPASLFLTYSVAEAFIQQLIWTVNMVYFIQVAGLNPLQLVLVGTALELSAFLFEIPTGVVADVYSRRISVIVGLALVGGGFILEGLVPLFVPILISQVIWGLGWTFTSGALQAWISDEVGEERAAGLYVRASRFGLFGALAAVGVSVALGGRALALPVVVGGVLFVLLSLYCLCFMPEDGWRPAPREDRGTFQQMGHTLQSAAGMVRRRPALAGIFGIGLFFGLYSEGLDRLWTAHLLERFSFPPLANLPQLGWFGLIAAVSMLISSVALAVVERRNLREPRRLAIAQAAVTAVLIVSLAGFALARSFWLALALYWLVSVSRAVIGPLYTAWINHRLDPSVRATIISASGQVDAFGQIAGGPLVGLIAQSAGLQAGLLASAALLTPVAPLFAGQIRARESETEPVELA